ncbi:MAG: flavin-containing monooxygenase [Candidatus Dormibacteria bacterium]
MQMESIETVVIGGGQAGLSVGYQLRQQGRNFVILDAGARVGDSWRNRWDSLRLFTPAHLDGLAGMRFPGPRGAFPTKDQMGDFLESYARKFELPVRNKVRVERLARDGARFVVETADGTIHADNVVVAMSSLGEPRVPDYAAQLAPGITQVHSHHYRNLDQLRDGPTLIVGVGNSGADIAMEVATRHTTWLAGTESGAIPFRIEPFLARHVMMRLVRFVGHRVLTVRTPIGRKIRPMMFSKATPLVRVKPKDLAAACTRVARIAGVKDGMPVTEDGQAIEVANVIWCTGYRPGFSWIDMPILGDHQEPEHQAGIVADVPGLYFVGLFFLYAMTSETVNGVTRDAKRIVKHLVARQEQTSTRDTVPGQLLPN